MFVRKLTFEHFSFSHPAWFLTLAKRSSVISNFPMVASVLMIVALTFERHFAICNPHKYRIHLRTVPR